MAVLTRQFAPLPTIDAAYLAFSIQGQLRAITLSLSILAFLTVAGRVYVRYFVLGVFRTDDYLMVAAMLFSAVGCAFFLRTVYLGVGRHFFAIPPQNLTELLMWVYIMGILNPISLCFTKLSIAFFLLSLTHRTRDRRFLWGMIGFLVIFMLFTFFSLILSCTPIQANWKFELRPPPVGTGTARCLDFPTFRAMAMTNTIINIITDVLFAVLPVPMIWTLQVNMRTKISLIFILSLGFFACGAGIVKAPLLFHFFDDIDVTGNRSWYYAWQIIEMNVGIIAATLPSLKPAFRWFLENAKALATGASRNRTAGSQGYSQGYKRQFSSSSLPNRGGNSYATAVGGSDAETPKRTRFMDPIEMELNELGPYQVTVAGDEKSVEGSGRESNVSSDAILHVDGDDSRRIVKTTKVTVVTTSSSG
ncbi:hypothetical protein BCR34DRAFT_514285 [Clohesyomyces aquaticus]|uniref:Rhodopsin domain-containing protein n=1 Tax=Clohesyomyces aquaticus TaxID=1231657 RepID=A0A1Y1ZLT7_9PLEO|nr:hypothetical protein BCR34DRAFT_514285 [Clohesyomyces aquaticus]